MERRLSSSVAAHKGLFNHHLEACEKGTKGHLTIDHINLNSYSRMTVKYAAQVLSETSKLIIMESSERKETAKFCLLMDKFFD